MDKLSKPIGSPGLGKQDKPEQVASCSGLNRPNKSKEASSSAVMSRQNKPEDFASSSGLDRQKKPKPSASTPSTSSFKAMNLPVYDVIEILETIKENAKDEFNQDDELIKIIDDVIAGDVLESAPRKRLFRVLSDHLHFKCASDPKEVTTKMKEGLAKSFVMVCPQYESHLFTHTWEAIYDRKTNTGYLANTSRRIQKRNRTRKSKKGTSDDDDASSGSELDDEMLAVLNVTMPGRAEKAEILNGMAKSFRMREKYRAERKSIHEFMTDFVHLAHYDGEVIREEFSRMYPNAEDKSKNLLTKKADILTKLPETKSVSLGVDDDVLKCIVRISQHLPHDIRRAGDRTSVLPKLKDFFVVLSPSDDILDYVEQRKSDATEPLQPYLVLIKGLLGNKVAKHFLILDAKIVELAGCSTIKAVQHLLQTFFIFNVCLWAGGILFMHCLYYSIRFLKNGNQVSGLTE
ncbi:hypothetical protein ONE63_000022 [Megalurothrips usitatus]|uniref:Uncharacterized protein n=1 Tax=Megalurothrips usitatus TaxID=439358 RepID=A0AAV7Y231_9NEOP|nr:hypothetical protein ONE63_000022 [Megalurothrips usitatus]